AAEILKEIHALRGAIPAILYHHERYDGKGYPLGLKGEEIPLSARILAVSDVYQALVSDRPYRKAYSKKKALKIIKEESGKHFDVKVVKIFLKVIDKINGKI
ncbi:MAG: HD domain-containing phosphohydrolase, partial [Candidatus Omnitrophota bacterium]